MLSTESTTPAVMIEKAFLEISTVGSLTIFERTTHACIKSSASKNGAPQARPRQDYLRLVDVVQRVIDVELARWRNKVRVLDHGLELTRLVVDDDDCAFLLLA